MIETAAGWQINPLKMTEMPLATDSREIADVLQRLGERALFERKPILGPGPHDADLQPVSHRIPAGQQRRPGRRAHRLNIKRFQSSARCSELVDVRRFNFAV